MSSIDIGDLLLKVQKPARYIGGESGSADKPLTDDLFRVALCFPDIYEVAESHVGLRLLYDVLNCEEAIFAERVYAVWPDLAELLEARGLPLFSLETHTPLSDFDLVGFSLNHELSYPTVLHMLELGRVPVWAADRGEDDPIVLAGGPALFNPEPLAPFFDAIFIGDGEQGAVEVAQYLRQHQDSPRGQRLAGLAGIDGVYVPGVYVPEGDVPGGEQGPRIKAQKIQDLDASEAPKFSILPHVRAVHDRAVVELQRGCSRGCRFCQAGMIYRPTRQRSPQSVERILTQAVQLSGHEDAGLMSLSAGDYCMIEPLLARLGAVFEKQRVSLSVPSLRVETLSTAMAREICRVRKSGFTLAPEAATERLRRVIAKGNTEQDLIHAVQSAFAAGATHVKLYFMIGLPTETDEDVSAISGLVRRLMAQAKTVNRRARATVSLSTFVPKSHTAFQWHPQIGLVQARQRQQLVLDGLAGSGVAVRWHEAEMSTVEGIYARGDRRLAKVLYRVFQQGARLDAWNDFFDYQRHIDALQQEGLHLEDYLGERDLEQPLPWQHIDCGVANKYLLRERRAALAEKTVEDCVLSRCRGCGACDMKTHRTICYHPGPNDEATRVERPLLHPSNRGVEIKSGGAQATDLGEGKNAQRVADQVVSCLRLRFSKHAPAIYLSHLETMATLARAIRRAGLPMAYSGGFHAKPKMRTPHALPVGVESLDELVDVDLYSPFSALQAADSLARQLPRGLRLLDTVTLPPVGPGLGVTIGGAHYRVRLNPVPEVSLQRFLQATTWLVTRVRKGRETQVDLKNLILDLQATDEGVEFILLFPANGTLKPMEVIASIFDGEEISPLDLVKTKTIFCHDLPISLQRTMDQLRRPA